MIFDEAFLKSFNGEEKSLVYENYLSAGVHIGMKQRTKDMSRFIFKVRPDGLSVLNTQMIDERIKIAAKFLSTFKRIVVASRRSIAFKAVAKFAELAEAKAITGRFLPGIITNPSFREYYEPDVVIITDPLTDKQALTEAAKMRIPIISLCDTFNETNYIDFIIPCNNKGRKAIATVFFELTKEFLKIKGKIKSDEEFKLTVEDFEPKIKTREPEELPREIKERR